MEDSQVGAMVMEALRSRLVRGTAVVASAVGIVVLFIGQPALWTEVSAAWASAIGSFAAAVVALYLGLKAMLRDQANDARRAKGAALVFLSDATSVLNLLEFTDGHLDISSPRALEALKEQIMEMPIVLTPDRASFLADLPEELSSWIVLLARVQTSFIEYMKTKTELSLGDKIGNLDSRVGPAAYEVGNRLYRMCVGGNNPPWKLRPLRPGKDDIPPSMRTQPAPSE